MPLQHIPDLPAQAPAIDVAKRELERLKEDVKTTKQQAGEQLAKAFSRLSIAKQLASDAVEPDLRKTPAKLIKGAKRNCRRAIEKGKKIENENPDQLAAQVLLGYLRATTDKTGLALLKKQKKASQNFKKAKALLPNGKDDVGKSQICRMRGDSKAIRGLSDKWQPRFLGHSRQSMLSKSLREYDEALSLLTAAQNTERADILYSKAIVFAGLGQTNNAFEVLSELEALERSTRLYNLRGNLFYVSNDFRQAEACYRQALALDVNYKYSLWNMAALFEKSYRLAEAKWHYECLGRIDGSALAREASKRAGIIAVEQGQWGSINIGDEPNRMFELNRLLDTPISKRTRNTTIGETTESRQVVDVKTIRTWPAIKNFSGTARVRDTGAEVRISGNFYQPSQTQQHVTVREEIVITKPLAHEMKNACHTLREMIQALASFEWSAEQKERGKSNIEHLAHGIPGIAATEQLFKDLQALVGLAKFSQEYTALIVNPTLKGIANPGLKSTAYLKSESAMSLPFRATFFNAYRPRELETVNNHEEVRVTAAMQPPS